MEKLRAIVHAHISKPTIFVLIGLSLTGLGLLSQSFLLSTKAILANFDSDFETVPMQASVSSAHVLGELITETIPPPSLEVPNRTLTFGDEGSDVILLQEFLLWRGFWPEGEEVSGYFGKITEDAVRAYQVSSNIEAEGVVGPRTRDLWLSDIVNFKPISG